MLDRLEAVWFLPIEFRTQNRTFLILQPIFQSAKLKLDCLQEISFGDNDY